MRARLCVYIGRERARVYVCGREFPFGRFNFSTIASPSTIHEVPPLRATKKGAHVCIGSRVRVCVEILHALRLVAILRLATTG